MYEKILNSQLGFRLISVATLGVLNIKIQKLNGANPNKVVYALNRIPNVMAIPKVCSIHRIRQVFRPRGECAPWLVAFALKTKHYILHKACLEFPCRLGKADAYRDVSA